MGIDALLLLLHFQYTIEVFDNGNKILVFGEKWVRSNTATSTSKKLSSKL